LDCEQEECRSDDTMKGRSIRIFLVDGTASGLRTAELGLSTIKAVVVPRASLSEAGQRRPELSKTGVYVLLGPASDGRRHIYIGEADTVITRLTNHIKEKDFWTDAVIFVSKDEALTKAHVRYLEARLIKLAKEAKRSDLANGTTPSEVGKLPEADVVEMEQFVEQARLLLGALGYDVFESACSVELAAAASDGADAPTFQFAGDGFSASCVVSSERGQFVVVAGSRARKTETNSLLSTYRTARAELVNRGVLRDAGTHYELTQDYAFGSASAAAAVVSGQTINGRTAWKHVLSDETLGEWEDRRLPEEVREEVEVV